MSLFFLQSGWIYPCSSISQLHEKSLTSFSHKKMFCEKQQKRIKKFICEDEYEMSSFSTLIPALTGEKEHYEDYNSCQRKWPQDWQQNLQPNSTLCYCNYIYVQETRPCTLAPHSHCLKAFSYLCTYVLYSPVHNVLDACISITRASGRGWGPGNREFLGPCEMASSR